MDAITEYESSPHRWHPPKRGDIYSHEEDLPMSVMVIYHSEHSTAPEYPTSLIAAAMVGMSL